MDKPTVLKSHEREEDRQIQHNNRTTQRPPHNKSNGAALGGPANQVQGVGHGAGGPGDGQGPGLGARSTAKPVPKNLTGPMIPRMTRRSVQGALTRLQTALTIHPEPPANAFETQTDDSNDSNDQTQTTEQTKDTNQHPDKSTPAIHPEPPRKRIRDTNGRFQRQQRSNPNHGTDDTNQHPDKSTPAIHPEPPANAFETQTDDSNDSNHQAQSEDQPHHISSQASNNTPDATPEPTTTAIPNNILLKQSKHRSKTSASQRSKICSKTTDLFRSTSPIARTQPCN